MPAPLSSSRPHVLYVTWGFPPMSGGGAYRTMATANVLVENGFDVTVLTAESDAYVGLTAVDDALIKGVDERIHIRRLPFPDPVIEHNIRNWSRERASSPRQWLASLLEEVEFPEARFGAWKPILLRAADDIQATRPIDLVVASANPHVDLSVGPHLHAKHGIPHVVDHRDSWRLNWYNGTEAHADDPRVAATETEIVRTAHEVWFVNEAIADWHRQLYPFAAAKIRVVPNGYDAQYAPAPVATGPEPTKPLRFTYVGALSPAVPVTEFVEGWVTARTRSADIANATAQIFGPLRLGDHITPGLLREAAAYGVKYLGAAAKEDLAGIYEASDVLVLLLAGGPFVTSGKVFEYAASGLPIVSAHEPDNGAGRVLDGYPLWTPTAGLAADQLSDALIRAAQVARTASPEARSSAGRFARGLERKQQLRPPIEDLFTLVQDRRRAVR